MFDPLCRHVVTFTALNAEEPTKQTYQKSEGKKLAAGLLSLKQRRTCEYSDQKNVKPTDFLPPIQVALL